VQPPHGAGHAIGVTVRQDDDAFVLVVSGDLDLETISPLVTALVEIGEHAQAGPVVLDLSGVGFADSSTVNVLLRAHSALGPRLRVARPSAFIRRLFDIIGLWQALSVYDTVEDALVRDAPDPSNSEGPADPVVPGAG
jgi:anti-sigma B factor antagonist